MNNWKIKVTRVAQAYDISAVTTITLRNVGENDISLGFWDLDDSFAFGEWLLLKVGEVFSISNTDARRGDGTFYAVTKNTEASKESFLSYAADGGVAPVLLVTSVPTESANDVAIDSTIVLTFSNSIDEVDAAYIVDSQTTIVASTNALSGSDKILTITPGGDLELDTDYELVYKVVDVYGRVKSGVLLFRTVAE